MITSGITKTELVQCDGTPDERDKGLGLGFRI
jgi:hypothetical protein